MSKKTLEKSMNIEVRIYPVRDRGKLLARATVTLNGCFAVTGLQIVEGKEQRPFVSMPSRKVGTEYKDVCFPCTSEFRKELNDTVLAAFEQAMAEQTQKSSQLTPEPSM